MHLRHHQDRISQKNIITISCFLIKRQVNKKTAKITFYLFCIDTKSYLCYCSTKLSFSTDLGYAITVICLGGTKMSRVKNLLIALANVCFLVILKDLLESSRQIGVSLQQLKPRTKIVLINLAEACGLGLILYSLIPFNFLKFLNTEQKFIGKFFLVVLIIMTIPHLTKAWFSKLITLCMLAMAATIAFSDSLELEWYLPETLGWKFYIPLIAGFAVSIYCGKKAKSWFSQIPHPKLKTPVST